MGIQLQTTGMPWVYCTDAGCNIIRFKTDFCTCRAQHPDSLKTESMCCPRYWASRNDWQPVRTAAEVEPYQNARDRHELEQLVAYQKAVKIDDGLYAVLNEGLSSGKWGEPPVETHSVRFQSLRGSAPEWTGRLRWTGLQIDYGYEDDVRSVRAYFDGCGDEEGSVSAVFNEPEGGGNHGAWRAVVWALEWLGKQLAQEAADSQHAAQ